MYVLYRGGTLELSRFLTDILLVVSIVPITNHISNHFTIKWLYHCTLLHVSASPAISNNLLQLAITIHG
jgi:hypothetical protein